FRIETQALVDEKITHRSGGQTGTDSSGFVHPGHAAIYTQKDSGAGSRRKNLPLRWTKVAQVDIPSRWRDPQNVRPAETACTWIDGQAGDWWTKRIDGWWWSQSRDRIPQIHSRSDDACRVSQPRTHI